MLHTDPPIPCSLGKAEHISTWSRVDSGTKELPQQHIWRWSSWLTVPWFFASLRFKLLRKRDGFPPCVLDTRALSVPRSSSSQYLWVREHRRPAQARRWLTNRRDEPIIQEASLGSVLQVLKKAALKIDLEDCDRRWSSPSSTDHLPAPAGGGGGGERRCLVLWRAGARGRARSAPRGRAGTVATGACVPPAAAPGCGAARGRRRGDRAGLCRA